jgi:hypothetical protein
MRLARRFLSDERDGPIGWSFTSLPLHNDNMVEGAEGALVI